MANIEFRVSYFKGHYDAWNGFSQDLSNIKSRAIEARPPKGALYASLLLGWVDTFNELADELEENLLQKGSEKTRELAGKLQESCAMYLQTEGINEDEATRIMQAGGF